MLCQRKGRDGPKDLEGVLPVLDRRLYDGDNGGVVFRAGFRTEASADLEFGLGRPQSLLACRCFVGETAGAVRKVKMWSLRLAMLFLACPIRCRPVSFV